MLFGVIGWVGAGLYILFVIDNIDREPTPTNLGCLGLLVGLGRVYIYCL
jgi:hypothetical protein